MSERRQIDPATASVGDEGPTLTVEDVEREDFVKYAGASGDFNPIHYDDTFARESGYPSVFAQGMFTAGVLASLTTTWFGLAPIRNYRVRFEDQVWPGDTIVATGEVTNVEEEDGETVVTARLVGRNQDSDTVISGEVTSSFDAE